MSLPDPTSFESLEALEAQRAREEDQAELDARFDDPNFLKGQLAEANIGLYGAAFVPPNERGEESQVVPLDNTQEALEEGNGEIQSEYTPIIERFIAQGYITREIGEELIEGGINGNNYHDIIHTSNLDEETQERLIQVLEYLNSPNTRELAETELQEQFPDIFGEYRDIDIENMSPFALTAYREICEHYIPNEDPDTQEANLGLAIEMASNKIVNEVHLSLNPGNREAFSQAMELAHNSEAELSDRFLALQRIAEIVNSGESIKGAGARSKADFRVAQQRRAEGAAQTEAFHAAQTARIEAAEADNALLGRQDIDETEQEGHVGGGDVFAGGVFDVGLDNTGEEGSERA